MADLVEILLVEDNPGDARLCQEALKESKMLNNLHIAKDGQEALDFIFKTGEYKNSPTPDLIILDLNLPKVHGKDVLKQIKESDITKKIPVVVLSSSKAEEDIIRSYELHANSYITKPLDFNQFIEIVKELNQFWLGIVKLPSKV